MKTYYRDENGVMWLITNDKGRTQINTSVKDILEESRLNRESVSILDELQVQVLRKYIENSKDKNDVDHLIPAAVDCHYNYGFISKELYFKYNTLAGRLHMNSETLAPSKGMVFKPNK